MLQRRDQLAVIERVGQVITAAGDAQINRQRQIKLEPLSQLSFVSEHPHVRPQPQPAHQDLIAGAPSSRGHNGRARWLKRRLPLA
jgi:hypothetical protein